MNSIHQFHLAKLLFYLTLGEITVAQPLDYETVKEYALSVQASDGGTPSLSSSTVIKINVNDANDNRPTFVQPGYEYAMREDIPVNTTVLQVSFLFYQSRV